MPLAYEMPAIVSAWPSTLLSTPSEPQPTCALTGARSEIHGVPTSLVAIDTAPYPGTRPSRYRTSAVNACVPFAAVAGAVTVKPTVAVRPGGTTCTFVPWSARTVHPSGAASATRTSRTGRSPSLATRTFAVNESPGSRYPSVLSTTSVATEGFPWPPGFTTNMRAPCGGTEARTGERVTTDVFAHRSRIV